jgi:wyosine [tRNA(Phe)-imidazoG37] synthetase (radical SAM superfamily)
VSEANAGRQPLPLHRDHRRSFADNLYAYPVISRRSKGLSVGVNLNPDKLCNFDCVYCQVDRRTPGGPPDVDLARLRAELEDMLDQAISGALYEADSFRATPPALRRLNDIAFAGDGEPTTCPVFPEAVRLAADARRERRLDESKLVLITNASQFHKPRVRDAVRLLHENNGEVWAKLEAGTEAYYHQIDRTTIPFRRILDNITEAARAAPLVIQALFLRLHGEPPPPAEQEAFCDRLNEIVSAGGQVKLVQVYTVARRPAESYVQALADAEVDALTELVRRRTGLAAEAFYGRWS